MRVEIEIQNGVLQERAFGPKVDGTSYNVVLVGKNSKTVLRKFMTPGTMLDGFLSPHQAKTRAAEFRDSMKEALGLDIPISLSPTTEVASDDRKPKRTRARQIGEIPSFA